MKYTATLTPITNNEDIGTLSVVVSCFGSLPLSFYTKPQIIQRLNFLVIELEGKAGRSFFCRFDGELVAWNSLLYLAVYIGFGRYNICQNHESKI